MGELDRTVWGGCEVRCGRAVLGEGWGELLGNCVWGAVLGSWGELFRGDCGEKLCGEVCGRGTVCRS